MAQLTLWITREDGSVTGPHGLTYLRAELNSGRLTLDHQACEEGTEDWMPLQTWGNELYPPETLRRGPYAQKAQYVEPKKGISPLAAVGAIIGFLGIIYFLMFYDVSVATEIGYVANLHKMNTRLVGLIASIAIAVLAIAVDLSKRKR